MDVSSTYIAIVFSIYVFVAIIAVAVDDLLLKRQYDKHRETWIADGRPRGVCFSPEGSSHWTYWGGTFKSLEERYYWIENDLVARRLYKVQSFLKPFVVWYSVLIVPVVVFIVVAT